MAEQDNDRPPMNRAKFLRQAWRRVVDGAAQAAGAAVEMAAESNPVLRPPGALAEADFLAACTQCGECITACPHDAIVLTGPASWSGALAAPEIRPRRMPCYLCDDLPCVKACGDGALVWPAGGREGVVMGLAVLHPSRCLAVRGESCDICVQCCPFPGKAIRIATLAEASDDRPIISPDHCTGCGICVHVCPTQPAALSVRPIRVSDSPTLKRSFGGPS